MAEQEHKRYPGTRPFRDDNFDRMLFKGRSKEIQQLLHLILAENLVVLFAKSGVGKSSLLNAGVFQPLREKNYFPIRIRMNDPGSDFIKVIDDEAKSVAKDYNIDATLKNKNPESESLWQYFKTAEFWSQDDTLLTPVLVFDQFEEIFTLEYTQEQRKNFFLQLADLVLGRTPESYKINKAQGKKSYSEKPPNIKVVISMREDFLAELEEMATDIPSILRNRFRLQALTIEQAREAIEEPARLQNEELATKTFSYDENAVSTILKFLNRRETLSDIKSGDDKKFWPWYIIGILILWIIVSTSFITEFYYHYRIPLLTNFFLVFVASLILAFVRPIKPVIASVTSLIFYLIFLFYLVILGVNIELVILGVDIEEITTTTEIIQIVFPILLVLSTIPGIISWRRLKKTFKPNISKGSVDKNIIEPFQLQLLCQHIEENTLPYLIEKNPGLSEIIVNVDDFEGEKGIKKILESFYINRISDVKPPKKKFVKAVRKLCENGLISPTGRRVSLAEESIAYEYNVSNDILNQLIEFRLLRKEPKLETFYYEICHDSMIEPILKAAKIFRLRRIVKFVVVGAIFLVMPAIAVTKYIDNKVYEKVTSQYILLNENLFNNYHTITGILNKYDLSNPQIDVLEIQLQDYKKNNKLIEELVSENRSLVKDTSEFFQNNRDIISRLSHSIDSLRNIASLVSYNSVAENKIIKYKELVQKVYAEAEMDKNKAILNSPFDSNKWYRLTNQWQGKGKSMEMQARDYVNNYIPVQLGTTRNAPEQAWKIIPLGGDWYRFQCELAGENQAIDLILVWGVYVPQIVKAYNASGQYWKITPLGGGWYRLTTRWQGDGLSLDVRNDGKNNILQLAKTGNYTGQYWKIQFFE